MTDPTEAIRKAHAAYAATGVLSPERRIALDDFYAACNPAAIRALLDRLDSAERDAKRYQWLRDQHWVEPEARFRLGLSNGCEDDASLYEKQLDAAIDEQLRSSDEKEPK